MNTRASLYQARYGSAEVKVPSAGSHLIDQLLSHRSVRAYLPDPVSDDTLTAIIAAARSAIGTARKGTLANMPAIEVAKPIVVAAVFDALKQMGVKQPDALSMTAGSQGDAEMLRPFLDQVREMTLSVVSPDVIAFGYQFGYLVL